MKRFLSVSMLAVLALASCTPQDNPEPQPEPQKPSVVLAQTSLSDVPEEGTTGVLKFSANLPWRVVSSVEWIEVDAAKSAGMAAEACEVPFTVLKNRETIARSGKLSVVITDDYKVDFTVSQVAAVPVSTVTTVYVKPDGTGDGKTWATATSLSKALGMGLNDGDEICLAAGTYYPDSLITGHTEAPTDAEKTFEIKENINIKGGFPANPANGDVANPSTNITILDGKKSSYHTVVVSAAMSESAAVTISGVTVTGGNASGTESHKIGNVNYTMKYAGGVMVGESNVVLNDCIISDNSAMGCAGGVYVFSKGIVTMNNCTVKNNICTATGANGAGITAEGATLVMKGGKVVNNYAGAFCGGVYLYKAGTVANSLTNVQIEGNCGGGEGLVNNGKYYGGFYLREASAVLLNCSIVDNKATGAGAGIGVYGTASAPATLDLISCTVYGNQNKGAKTGAGIFVNCAAGNATVSLYNSIVANNTYGPDGTGTVSDEDGGTGWAVNNYSSAIGTVVYTENASAGTSTFDHASMLKLVENDGTHQLSLVGNPNPAITEGMSTTDLEAMANNYAPALEAAVLDADQFGNSRTGKKCMGSYVK